MASSKTPAPNPEGLQAELDAIKARRASRAQRDVRDSEFIRKAAEQDRRRQEEVQRRLPLLWIRPNSEQQTMTAEQLVSWNREQGRRAAAAERAQDRAYERQREEEEALKTAQGLLGLEPDATLDQIRRAYEKLAACPQHGRRRAAIARVREILVLLARRRPQD